MDSLEFEPMVLKKGFLKYWWIIMMSVLVGGLLALLISFSLPPIYETSFKIVTDVRIKQNDAITEIMLDAAINHVGDLAFNPYIVERVISALNNQEIILKFDEFLDIASVERRLNTTYLKVQNRDPQTAELIADTWGLVLYEMLEDGYKKAIVAEGLNEYQESLANCLENSTETQCGTYCGLSRDELEGEITRVGGLVAQNRNESLGLYPELTIAEYQEADYPEKPFIYGQRSLIVAGAGIGLLIGVLFIELWLPRRRTIN